MTATKAATPRARRADHEPAAGVPTRTRRSKAVQAATADPAQVLAELGAAVTAAQAALAAAMAERDSTVARLLSEKAISGPKAAAALGVTTMAVYNMRNRAAK